MPIDLAKYPPNWQLEIVPRILKRAGHKCEMCRLANHQQVHAVTLKVQDTDLRYKPKVFWFAFYGDALRAVRYNAAAITRKTVSISVAHLDHDEDNWNVTDDRLAALCQLCHLNYDAKDRFNRRKDNLKMASV